MQLIGINNSPYVRRVAISMELLGIPFELVELSTFGDFEAFKAINPMAKAPTLVCDDGDVILDSSLILQYLENNHASGRTLWPSNRQEYQHDMVAVSIALGACEKVIQAIYETKVRPEESRYQYWFERVLGQMASGFEMLEGAVAGRAEAFSDSGRQASVTTAVIWTFTCNGIPELVEKHKYPALCEHSKRMEASPPFQKWAIPGIR